MSAVGKRSNFDISFGVINLYMHAMLYVRLSNSLPVSCFSRLENYDINRPSCRQNEELHEYDGPWLYNVKRFSTMQET
jgi:hypothetical protein